MVSWKTLVAAVSGDFNTELARQIDFLKAENRALRRQLGGRPRLSEEERRTLAELGRPLGRRVLSEISTIVTPDTIYRWFRRLVARKFDASSRRRPGRPPTAEEIRELVLRVARENPGWGSTRIRDVLKNLGHTLSRSTVANILRESGIDPAPERRSGMTWKEFLAAHKDVFFATDFFCQEVLTPLGLVTYYILFFIHVGTRRVRVAGITRNPDSAFMESVARDLTSENGFLNGARFLLHDRDSKYSAGVTRILKGAGIKCIRLPRRSPNLNAFAERWIQSVRGECLDRLILLGERSLRYALEQYLEHYHRERPHQGLDGRLVEGGDQRLRPRPKARAGPRPKTQHGEIRCRERIGGLLKFYYRESA